MTTNQKLDLMLSYFKEKQHNKDFDRQNVKWGTLANTTCGGNNPEFASLLSTIIEDGYIDFNFGTHFITPKGNNFIGYEKTELKQIDDENKANDLINEQKDNLRAATEDIKKNPYRFRVNIIITGIGVLISLAAIIITKCEESKVSQLEKKQNQLEKSIDRLSEYQDSILNYKKSP